MKDEKPIDESKSLPVRRQEYDQTPGDHSTEDSEQEGSGGRQADGGRRTRRGQRKPSYRSRDELLALLNKLPGMIISGNVSVAEANAMKGVFKVMLDELDRAGGATHSTTMPDSLINKLREHPELLEWFEPFLTDEQFDHIVKGMTDDNAI